MIYFQASVEACHVHKFAQARPCNAMHYTSISYFNQWYIAWVRLVYVFNQRYVTVHVGKANYLKVKTISLVILVSPKCMAGYSNANV